MRKRRARRRLNWGPVLWLFFVVNVAAGLTWSRATSAQVVRVYGALPYDEARISQQAQFLKDVPCLRVDKARIEEKVGFAPEVRTVELRRNVFGRAELRVQYREPVARLAGSTTAYLSDEGVLFTQSVERTDLPSLKLDGELDANLAYASPWPLGRLVQVAKEATLRESLQNAEIQVFRSGAVCLNLQTATRIQLGPLEAIGEKFKAYDELLQSNPNLLKDASELILVAPSRPAFKKRT